MLRFEFGKFGGQCLFVVFGFCQGCGQHFDIVSGGGKLCLHGVQFGFDVFKRRGGGFGGFWFVVGFCHDDSLFQTAFK